MNSHTVIDNANPPSNAERAARHAALVDALRPEPAPSIGDELADAFKVEPVSGSYAPIASPFELKPLDVSAPDVRFLSMVIYGPEGSGKTTLALDVGRLAVLREAFRSRVQKPLGILSTEPGVALTWRARLARGNARSRVEVLAPEAPTRRFSDLLAFLETARERCSAIVIDSVTHFRRDCEQAYRRERGRTRLDPSDREAINLKWREFTDRLSTLDLHVILVGRAADQYEDELDEESPDRRNRVRTGTRADAGRDIGYEPLVVVEMFSQRLRRRKTVAGRLVEALPRATVVKDRTGSVHGERFDCPKAADFRRVFDAIDGGRHAGGSLDVSQDLYADETRRRDRARARDAALEELAAAFDAHGLGGQTKEAKQRRAELLRSVFGFGSETNLRELSPEQLDVGLGQIEDILAKVTPHAGAPS